MTTRRIEVGELARVEGEGGLSLTVRDGLVTDATLSIYEPPRFFERILIGRAAGEAPDITARICGICPVAYQMSAVGAIEAAWGVEVSEPVRRLRRLLYCGEWIESHALHVFMLHAPDFLGYADAAAMAKDHPDLVRAGLRIKKAGNALVAAIGGREIHPVSVCIGGFYRAPHKRDLTALTSDLAGALDDMRAAMAEIAAFPFPEIELSYEFVALGGAGVYPFTEGRIVSNRGLDIDADAFEATFLERHAPHSNALHGFKADGGIYAVGPLARFNLNREALTPLAREVCAAAGLGGGTANPFRSILVRGIEIVFALEEALALIDAYEAPDPPFAAAPPREGRGAAATEAPRGLLYHRYETDAAGRIRSANIVPPTSQNQPTIEADLKAVAQRHVAASDEELTWRCEQAIRNYDPCISCATHFLRLTVDRAAGRT